MGITSMLVQDESLPKDAKESLGLIQASSSLLLVLINNLLDIRKLNANSKYYSLCYAALMTIINIHLTSFASF